MRLSLGIFVPVLLVFSLLVPKAFAQTEQSQSTESQSEASQSIEPQSEQAQAEPTQPEESQSETRSMKVLRIDVSGNQVVHTSTILNNMKTRPGVELNQRMINEDVKRLYGTGFFQDIRMDVEELADGVHLIVLVDEKPVVRRIVLEGMRVVKERDLRKDLGVIEGQVLDEFAVQQGLNKIKERYAKQGFHFVRVRYRVETDRATKEATVFVTIEEGAKYRVSEIRFSGVQSFKEKRLRKLMKTKPRNLWLFRLGRFRDEKFRDDLDQLAAFYQWNGFLDVRIGHDFEYDEVSGRMVLKIEVEEGKRYVTGEVNVEGVNTLPESEVWQRLTMLPGQIYSQQGLAQEIQTIRDFYHNLGYMAVQISPDVKVNHEQGKVDVTYRIEEGDLHFVDKVKIRGNTKTKDIVIRREVRIRPGDKFDGEAITRSKQRLENLGFFEEVSYETEPGTAPNRKDIIFRVKEKRTGELSFGAGISSIDQFIGFAEIAQRNFDLLNWPRFTGGGQDIALRARWGTITRNFELSFVEPYVWNQPISFGLDLFDIRREKRNVDFREERLGFGTTFSRAFAEFLRVGLGYKLERVELFDIESDAPRTVELFRGKNWLSRLKLFLKHDRRDNVFFPKKGWLASLSSELIGSFLGGDEDYYILQGSFTKYWGFREGKHVIEWSVRLGFADEFGDSEEVPVFDRFFAGGLGTVRGYNFRRVGPIESGSAIGGASMALMNLEYSFEMPYLENFKGAFFVDVGDVERDAYNISLDEFRVSVGPGIKIVTPLGPVAFYYGFPVANRDVEDKNGRFEFSLAHPF